mmetsp:Transcript_18961/g.19081  ORF Transcript_18961/g.19081 Transcript_18961/m.19081 type:complete len:735 (-) Transcript_18961:184-2388(-)
MAVWSIKLFRRNMVYLFVIAFFMVNYTNSFISRSRIRNRDIKINNAISDFEDDGYSHTFKESRVVKFFDKINILKRKTPGTLILVRHGESEWNFNNTFTGWVDVDLCERGRREIEHAARILLASGYDIDITYTSRLKRAIKSSWILQREGNQIYRPLYKSWRLNERMYGELEGLSKPDIASKLGEDVVQQFRNGLFAKPPPMKENHPHWHKTERKYADLHPDQIPVTESLQDTMERTLPLWYARILPDLENGKNVMVVAHANSLRGIVKYVDQLSDDQIRKVAIPNGIPLVYKFDRNMKPIVQEFAVPPISGGFLEKKGLLRDALAKEQELAKFVPGYKMTDNRAPPLDPLLRSLTYLDLEHKLSALASGNISFTQQPAAPAIPPAGTMLSGALSLGAVKSAREESQILKKPVMVIIRHGKTEHNKLGLFTGWEDAPLAEEGREEARAAGRLLKAHGVEFDMVYTSWLSRAIETAWILMNQMDSVWLPIVKTWRLNERMYGALTGMSKKMIQQKHGEKQFKLWRRSYKTRPPVVSSFSANYPGNDARYCDNVKDVRYSVFESIIRSIGNQRIQLHRKFPKTESLSDCCKRTIPYFKDVIIPNTIAQNKSVLIASSENAIRGLLMELCEIPAKKIHELEIPTGVPIIYDVKKKRIRLLDDGLTPDPIERYNFGEAKSYIFRPCEEDLDDECNQCYLDSGGGAYAYDPLIRLPQPMPVVTSVVKSNVTSSATVLGY